MLYTNNFIEILSNSDKVTSSYDVVKEASDVTDGVINCDVINFDVTNDQKRYCVIILEIPIKLSNCNKFRSTWMIKYNSLMLF